MFAYDQGDLTCDGVSLTEIARTHGTPVYVYSRASIIDAYRRLDEAFAAVPHTICYALKANGNLSIAREMSALGAGADIVSGGELYRAQRAGIPASLINFAGVAKTEVEIEQALTAGIMSFNVESAGELEAVERVASRLGVIAPVSLRVNPDVDPDTHPYIATGMKKYKFGIVPELALRLYARARDLAHVDPIGIQFHIGSQLLKVAPLAEAVDKMLAIGARVRNTGIPLRYLNIGGGLGISYGNDEPEGPEVLAAAIGASVREAGYHLIIEPGRYLMGNAGVLVSRILYEKDNGHRKFVIVDAAMNDFIRPVLYDAYHTILPVREKSEAEQVTVDVVGGIGESADFFARSRGLPRMDPGELIALMSAGAYGFSMSSNYNGRPRPAEVMVADGNVRVIRRRETYEDLVRGED